MAKWLRAAKRLLAVLIYKTFLLIYRLTHKILLNIEVLNRRVEFRVLAKVYSSLIIYEDDNWSIRESGEDLS